MSALKKYRKLYTAAEEVDPIVKGSRIAGHLISFKELNSEPDENVEKDILMLGNIIVAKYENEGKTADHMPPETLALIKFSFSFEPEEFEQSDSGGGPSRPPTVLGAPAGGGGASYLAGALGAMQAASKASGTPSGVTTCKDPLGPGDTTFDQIAGQEDTKENIKRSYIYPYKYPALFPTKSKGIMFYGPPGVGKTLLAKASTAQIPGSAFFAPSPGEMRGKFEGETEKNIAAVFDCAAQIIGKPIPVKKDNKGKDIPESVGLKYKVAIIFIDEFDSLAAARGDDPGMRRSVNALLQGMDGIKSSANVSVIAATNFPWDIDDAVLRRFSAKIFIDLPKKFARRWLMNYQIATVYNNPREKERDARIMKVNEKRKDGNKIKIPKQVIMNREFNPDTKLFEEDFLPGIFQYVDKLGIPLCSKQEYHEAVTRKVTTGGIGGYGGSVVEEIVEPERYVTTTTLANKEYIDMIATTRHEDGGMEMSEEASMIIKRIKENQEVDAEDVKDDDKDYWFGFSGSDIDKIMDIAIQTAASRALDNAFYVATINKVPYFVSTHPTDTKARFTVTEDAARILNAEYNLALQPLTNDQAERAINYSLCEGDIKMAMEKYPSTIKSRSYVDLLLFEYQGKVPKPKKKDE